jgi:hypothetical protein
MMSLRDHVGSTIALSQSALPLAWIVHLLLFLANLIELQINSAVLDHIRERQYLGSQSTK